MEFVRATSVVSIYEGFGSTSELAAIVVLTVDVDAGRRSEIWLRSQRC